MPVKYTVSDFLSVKGSFSSIDVKGILGLGGESSMAFGPFMFSISSLRNLDMRLINSMIELIAV